MATAASGYIDEMSCKARDMSSSNRGRTDGLACHAHMVKDVTCLRVNTIPTYFEANRIVSHSLQEYGIQKPGGRHKVIHICLGVLCMECTCSRVLARTVWFPRTVWCWVTRSPSNIPVLATIVISERRLVLSIASSWITCTSEQGGLLGAESVARSGVGCWEQGRLLGVGWVARSRVGC